MAAFTGAYLYYHLPTLAPRGMPLDTDNLCEPPIYALTKCGYFQGKRKNMAWWHARKRVAEPTGAKIVVDSTPPVDLRAELGSPFFDHTYTGNLPSSASDPSIPKWISSIENISLPNRNDRLAISLKFGSSRVSLGNISTGPIKSIIDCLYPIIGGEISAPDDWKIDLIQVQKDLSGINPESVSIAIWIY